MTCERSERALSVSIYFIGGHEGRNTNPEAGLTDKRRSECEAHSTHDAAFLKGRTATRGRGRRC